MKRNPLLDPNSRLVIAHRGNRIAAPENTLDALRQAVALNVDALEFDVRMTRDGVPVLMHDATVDRTTDGRGPLNQLSLAEAQALNAGARQSAGASREPIPTLEQVFEAFPSTPFVIEVKELAAAAATGAMVRRFGAEARVIVGSATTAVMEFFYRSGLASCASMKDAMLLIPFGLLGIKPPKPFYDVLSLTTRYHGVPIPVRQMAAAARKVGVPTQVWTVNDPGQARSLWHAGVAAIVTDDPAAILRARS
ncbi:MAG TPA: glycerophosphodiester phosphodiesterase family protein [Gemmatimonadaceae bacterium]|nr:glycerophosphodiester phosphodiesterase family protein [Gemmatimonadaceae bacterium]